MGTQVTKMIGRTSAYILVLKAYYKFGVLKFFEFAFNIKGKFFPELFVLPRQKPTKQNTKPTNFEDEF